MPETEPLIRLSKYILAKLRKPKRASLPKPIQSQIASTSGYKLRTTLYLHPTSRSFLLLCPDRLESGQTFQDGGYPIDCTDVFGSGHSFIFFAPAGRGGSWGLEDYGGLEHQDNVACMLNYIHAEYAPSQVLILSMGLGLSMALGGIAQAQKPPAVLIDIEGPSDREFIKPQLQKTVLKKDHIFWRVREPIELLCDLPYRYIRIQCRKDHCFQFDHRHTHRMLRALQKYPKIQFQLNNHPIGTIPPQPDLWLGDKDYMRKELTILLSSLAP
ncbi:MAG: hypothetical protein VX278_10410 [Myxococcota bacterium]|nr:hypothetical protein [Myxococcota bacterium]